MDPTHAAALLRLPLWAMALAFVASLAFAVVPHELGHYAVARLAGLQPRTVTFGSGRILGRWRAGRTWFVLRLKPLSGSVELVQPPSARRSVLAATLLAGGLSNIALSGALICLSGVTTWAELLLPLAYGQAIGGLVELAPFRIRSVASDGWQLLGLLSRRTTPQAGYTPSADLLEVIYQGGRRDKRRDAWARRESEEVIRGVLSAGRLGPVERSLAIDILLSNALTLDDTGVTAEELDRLSLEALAIAPSDSLRVTRGGVLIRLGRAAEAVPVLTEVVDRPMEEPARVACRVFLAQAAWRCAMTSAWRSGLLRRDRRPPRQTSLRTEPSLRSKPRSPIFSIRRRDRSSTLRHDLGPSAAAGCRRAAPPTGAPVRRSAGGAGRS